jgi:hypothetical protein
MWIVILICVFNPFVFSNDISGAHFTFALVFHWFHDNLKTVREMYKALSSHCFGESWGGGGYTLQKTRSQRVEYEDIFHSAAPERSKSIVSAARSSGAQACDRCSLGPETSTCRFFLWGKVQIMGKKNKWRGGGTLTDTASRFSASSRNLYIYIYIYIYIEIYYTNNLHILFPGTYT